MQRQRRSHNLLGLADLATDQAGLFTAAQAGDIGVSAKSLHHYTNTGLIERIAHGVYKIAGAPPSAHEELRALWLATNPHAPAASRLANPDVVVSHRSAARVHDLGDLDADIHEFTAAARRQTRNASVRIHKANLSPADVTVIDGLAVTVIERTIEDLAAGHLDGGHLAGVIRDAAAVVAVHEIASVLRPYAHRYGHPIGDGQGLVDASLGDATPPRSRAIGAP